MPRSKPRSSRLPLVPSQTGATPLGSCPHAETSPLKASAARRRSACTRSRLKVSTAAAMATLAGLLDRGDGYGGGAGEQGEEEGQHGGRRGTA